MISSIIYQLGLNNLEQKNNQYNSRCPICNDSKINSSKKRFWIYKKQNNWLVHCFNCNYSNNFNSFLKEFHQEIYFDLFKQSFKKDQNKIEEKELKKINNEVEKKFTKFPLMPCDVLPPDHSASSYLKEREIPKDKYKLFYYTKDFARFVNKFLTNNRYPLWKSDERLVIPFYKQNKEIFCVQGRSLDKNCQQRYLTVKLDEDHPKIYGLERVDVSKDVFVVEGPIDSLFLINGIGMAGSSVSEIEQFIPKEKIVFCFDLEPRNKEIKERVLKLNNDGYRISLISKKYKRFGKDLNDIYLNSGLTIEELNDIVRENIVEGKLGNILIRKWYEV